MYLCNEFKNKDIMEKVWKDVKNYEGIYQVSNKGNVKSLDRFVNGYRVNKQQKMYLEEELRNINKQIRMDVPNRPTYILNKKYHDLLLKKNKKEIELEEVKKEINIFKKNM